MYLNHIMSVADPGFPGGGDANSISWDENLLFGQIFPENCMKMKEIEPGVFLAPPWIRQ